MDVDPNALKICCILNNKAGGADGIENQIVALFAQNGVALVVLPNPGDVPIAELVSQAARRNFSIVVAAGGDGTINAVASAVLNRPSVSLGILPVGTLNHLAKDLGIPLTLPEAVEVICQGHEISIDVGQVNDVCFLNNSSVGLYPFIVRLRESLQVKGWRKWRALALSSLRVLARFRRLHLVLKLPDGNVVARRTALLFIGNNIYETAAQSAGTRRSLQDGLLWIAVSTSVSRWGLVKTVMALFFGRDGLADALTFEATELEVSSRSKLMSVATDGEVLKLKPPLNYRILPKALRVIVPAPISTA